MLQRTKLLEPSQLTHFQNGNCSFCLEATTPDQSFSHVDRNGKIKHVVGCSLGCVQSIFQTYRKKQGDIECPICCEKFIFLDREKILSQTEIEGIVQEISELFLQPENKKIKELISQLENQFVEDFFKLELIVPKALKKNNVIFLKRISSHLLETTSPENIYHWLFFFILSHHYNQSNWADNVWRDLCFIYSRQNPSAEPSISQDLLKALTAYEQFCRNSSISPRNTKIINTLSDKFRTFSTHADPLVLLDFIIDDYKHQQPTEDLIIYLRKNHLLLQHQKLPNLKFAKEELLKTAIEKSDVILAKHLLENFHFDLSFLRTCQSHQDLQDLPPCEMQRLIKKTIERKNAIAATSLFSTFILISWLYSQIKGK